MRSKILGGLPLSPLLEPVDKPVKPPFDKHEFLLDELTKLLKLLDDSLLAERLLLITLALCGPSAVLTTA